MECTKRKIIKLESSEDAVSFIIGVLLMVAMTIMMAAAAYLYLGGYIGVQQESPPDIRFFIDDSTDRITITNTDHDVKWSDLAIRVNADDVTFAINNEIEATGGTDLPENVLTKIQTTSTIRASDFIDLEGYDIDTSSPINVGELTISIVHIKTDAVLKFLDLKDISAAS